MKQLYLIIILAIQACTPLYAAPDTSKTLLAVAIMVKNEAPVIEKTLEPFVHAGVTHFLIYDTGSTDDTPEVAQQFFDQHRLTHTAIIKDRFIDFASSRNKVLESTYQHFPNATFVIMPDAEWYLHNAQELINFCKQQIYHSINAYMIRVTNKECCIYRPCLFKNNNTVHFKGAVHEYIENPMQQVPASIFFMREASEEGKKKTHARFIHDRDYLLQSYAHNPHDPHTVFFLAQTYCCLDDLPNAYRYYKERMNLPGCDENMFETLLRLGFITNLLSKTEPLFTWDMALDYYRNASIIRPQRAEPLVFVAQHFIDTHQGARAFPFAYEACQLPMPINDYNGVETKIYTFDRYETLSACAWSAGEYERGLWATKQALAVEPNVEHLHQKLCYYQDQIESKTTHTKKIIE